MLLLSFSSESLLPKGPRILSSRNERHESHRKHVLLLHGAVGLARDQQQLLHLPALADRNHHPAAWLELVDKGLRHPWRGGRDDDPVERPFLRPALVAVADA